MSVAVVTHVATDLLAPVAVDGLAEVVAQVGQDQIETFRTKQRSSSPAARTQSTAAVVTDACIRCCG